jgi:hypothetical protein
MRGERTGHDRPGQTMVASGLHDRAPTIDDRRAGCVPQPLGDPGTGRHLRHRLSERAPGTAEFVAAPPPLAQPQLTHPPRDGQVPRPGRHPLLHPHRPHPATGAVPRLLVRGGQVHHRPALHSVLDRDDSQSIQAVLVGTLTVITEPERGLSHGRSGDPMGDDGSMGNMARSGTMASVRGHRGRDLHRRGPLRQPGHQHRSTDRCVVTKPGPRRHRSAGGGRRCPRGSPFPPRCGPLVSRRY